MTNAWPRFVEIVRAGERFLLTSHMRPDCDGLGSELAMAGILEALGKQALIVNGDAVPKHLAFIDPDRKIQVLGDGVQADALAAVDVAIVLDTSAWGQLGPMAEVLQQSKARRLVVDHHVGQDDLGAELLKDTASESTGRLVIQAAEALGVSLTPAMAMPLFAAVATDSGWFRFSSVSGSTLRAAAELIDAGARPAAIYSALYEQSTLARLLLRGRVLAAAESHLEGRLLVTCARREDIVATGAMPGDTEDVVNMLLCVAGSQVAVIFQELNGGKIKASFRSRSDIDVRRVAEQFGGGGHTAAAGATLEGPLATARSKVLDALSDVIT